MGNYQGSYLTDRHGWGSHDGGRFEGQRRSESGLSLPKAIGLDPAERSVLTFMKLDVI